MMVETQCYNRCKKILLSLLSIAVLILSSCANEVNIPLPVAADYESPPAVEQKNLKLGVVPGPYGDMFMDAIEPLLAGKGYAVELVHYDDYIQPNIALANNEIDMNMFQHYKHLSSFKIEYNLDLSSITEIPTAAMGIFSSKHKSLKKLDGNVTVSIPSDSTNLARALQVLEAAGLVGIDPSVDKSKATVENLTRNPYNIKFSLEEAHSIAQSLDNYDLAVINGNYALSGGLNLSNALYNETLTSGYINAIAVRTSDLSSQFVADIIDVVYSKEYRQKILDNSKYKGFQLPLNFFDNRDWRREE